MYLIKYTFAKTETVFPISRGQINNIYASNHLHHPLTHSADPMDMTTIVT